MGDCICVCVYGVGYDGEWNGMVPGGEFKAQDGWIEGARRWISKAQDAEFADARRRRIEGAKPESSPCPLFQRAAGVLIRWSFWFGSDDVRERARERDRGYDIPPLSSIHWMHFFLFSPCSLMELFPLALLPFSMQVVF